ncbi:alpha/beta hydrolase [Agreia sp. COWG]|uniref:alpha/beta hydrolase n=1 Tax=Agreia sp. COWG TaxID=2773266 RepID=UPI001928A25D|nr:alpha/beta hydrolase [Agreia sp. COWG]CAD6011127.1 AB hydrolase-1 domain-containing protein [Agreia sp. COWG]
MSGPAATIFFLPGLGFGAAAVDPIAAALGDRFRVIGIDLPGHDGAPDAPDGSVSSLADAALAFIEAESDGGPWLLLAHSMGGKVAALVTSRVLGGEANAYGLAGSVLLAPSPPSPEPMDDDKRAEMLAWASEAELSFDVLRDGGISQQHAREFVAQNVATPLRADAESAALGQVRRMSPLSWRRWLTEGSLENLSDTLGALDLPVLVLAGDDDDDLGSTAQPPLLAEVYPRARFRSFASTGHLLPYEQPDAVAASITEFWQTTASAAPRVDPEWGRVIASARTAAEARGLLATRAIADDADYTPDALTPAQLTTLRALADRIVPQSSAPHIDLAARVDADIAAGNGDGWRPEGLPDDASAYRLGLDAIAAAWPQDGAAQDALIERIIAGDGIAGNGLTGAFSAAHLTSWFEDARLDLTRAWLAHPASLARIGYDGFATSGPGIADAGDASSDSAGYVTLAAGRRDPWEPTELGALASDDQAEPRAAETDNPTDSTGDAGKETLA